MKELPDVWRKGRIPSIFNLLPDDLIDSLFVNRPFGDDSKGTFPMDVTEEKDRYVIHADIAARKEDININFHEHTLVIQVQKGRSDERTEGKRIIRERAQMSAARSIYLPLAESGDEIEASFTDGTLTVIVPKSKEKQARKVEIK